MEHKKQPCRRERRPSSPPQACPLVLGEERKTKKGKGKARHPTQHKSFAMKHHVALAAAALAGCAFAAPQLTTERLDIDRFVRLCEVYEDGRDQCGKVAQRCVNIQSDSCAPTLIFQFSEAARKCNQKGQAVCPAEIYQCIHDKQDGYLTQKKSTNSDPWNGSEARDVGAECFEAHSAALDHAEETEEGHGMSGGPSLRPPACQPTGPGRALSPCHCHQIGAYDDECAAALECSDDMECLEGALRPAVDRACEAETADPHCASLYMVCILEVPDQPPKSCYRDLAEGDASIGSADENDGEGQQQHHEETQHEEQATASPHGWSLHCAVAGLEHADCPTDARVSPESPADEPQVPPSLKNKLMEKMRETCQKASGDKSETCPDKLYSCSMEKLSALEKRTGDQDVDVAAQKAKLIPEGCFRKHFSAIAETQEDNAPPSPQEPPTDELGYADFKAAKCLSSDNQEYCPLMWIICEFYQIGKD